MPRYAVIFKIHYWNDFVARQYGRLLRCAGQDVHILCDDTDGYIALPVPEHRVIRMTVADSMAAGFYNVPADRLFWYNTDYQLYHAAAALPGYDFYVTCEYDCVVTFDIADSVARMAALGADFAGKALDDMQPENWAWWHEVAPFYPPGLKIHGRLLCFAIFSAAFTASLRAARLEQSAIARRRQQADGWTNWPNNEGFVGAELALHRLVEFDLAAFGSLEHYAWGPIPIFEPFLDHGFADGCALLHPVLAGAPFFTSFGRKSGQTVLSLFDPLSPLHAMMAQLDAAEIVPACLDWILEHELYGESQNLLAYCEARGGQAGLCSVARLRPVAQSSNQRSAAGAVCGIAGAESRTAQEAFPWWQVDLQSTLPLRRIRITYPSREATANVCLSASLDGVHWDLLFLHPPDGLPEPVLDLQAPAGMSHRARFLRLHLTGFGSLHVRQVEAFV